MADNGNLLGMTHQEAGTSESKDENQKNNDTQNLSNEPLSNFGQSVDTIGLETALKLLPYLHL